MDVAWLRYSVTVVRSETPMPTSRQSRENGAVGPSDAGTSGACSRVSMLRYMKSEQVRLEMPRREDASMLKVAGRSAVNMELSPMGERTNPFSPREPRTLVL